MNAPAAAEAGATVTDRTNMDVDYGQFRLRISSRVLQHPRTVRCPVLLVAALIRDQQSLD